MGKSFWEFSCEAKVTNKANRDYAKRTRTTPGVNRAGATLVIVSARKWRQKAKWIEAKRGAGEWGEVRAYDADDLEQWLEQSPAVALQFADELGLTGPGVESVRRHWDGWSVQSDPSILAAALFVDRESLREKFLEELRRRLGVSRPEPYVVKADSVDEAAAFACAALLGEPDLSATALVVTEPGGWRFVDQNPRLRVAVAAQPEIAEKSPRREGLAVIIPYGAGDMAGNYRGGAGGNASNVLTLDRPRLNDFEKALVLLGVNEADAQRLSASTGRSWSVFRRRLAKNPTIQRPAWLDALQAGALSTVCLLGEWSAARAADREVVSRLSGRGYEEVERDLQHLALVDDAPIIRIGEVWKAKSPLELLDLFGDRITRHELNRFFDTARDLLLAPDPVLDLPDDQRFAAQVYGKVRPESGLLIRSVCDTLVELAVRGPHVPTLSAVNIDGRIATFVNDLLHNADETRWLSLTTFLPSLAEAAPDAFLRAVEHSFARPGAPVTRLFAETSDSSGIGKCWHADLLWALETLAWAPERLTRVVLVLARLAHVEVKGNWANTPKASLVDIFRAWFPQTAANLDQRVAALDVLTAKEPNVAFDLLDRLVHFGPDHAKPTGRPRWRDDDTGAGRGVTRNERNQMLIAAADRLIACSAGNPHRITRLLEKTSALDAGRIEATLALAEDFADPAASDEDREVIRSGLRKRIYWHRNYDKAQGQGAAGKLQSLERLYERLIPQDLVIRYRWLFADGWAEVPVSVGSDHTKHGKLLEEWRLNALQDIHAERGMVGIGQLAAACPNGTIVGVTLAHLDIDPAELATWIMEHLSSTEVQMAIQGLLHALDAQRSIETTIRVLERGKSLDFDAGQTARFLVLARTDREIWDLVAACGPEVEKAYWATVRPSFWLRNDKVDFDLGLHRLLGVGRPRSAFELCRFDLEQVDANLLLEMLERILAGEEPDGPPLDAWRIVEAVKRIEASSEVEKHRLIPLEIRLFPALTQHEDEPQAKVLYDMLMSDPHLFVELLGILYPKNGEQQSTSGEHAEAAGIVWQIFHECRRLPGALPDGAVDAEAFVKFVEGARECARDMGLLKVCDMTLGQILAHAPVDDDGTWPFQPARDVLDRPELEDMRDGFATGFFNKRGVTWRDLDEGGVQERELADMYRSYARALSSTHVNVAAILEKIARGYEQEALREDLEAKMAREGF